MSVLIGAERITDKHGRDYRLQQRADSLFGQRTWARTGYRFALPNGWHCGHWHTTPEDALACAISKGAPMQ